MCQPIVVLIPTRVKGRPVEVHTIREGDVPGNAGLQIAILIVFPFIIIVPVEGLLLLFFRCDVR